MIVKVTIFIILYINIDDVNIHDIKSEYKVIEETLKTYKDLQIMKLSSAQSLHQHHTMS